MIFIPIEKQIDLKTIDLKKLKVRDLKKILNDWDETCDGCLEKGDFIKRIEELKPKHIREELWYDNIHVNYRNIAWIEIVQNVWEQKQTNRVTQ